MNEVTVDKTKLLEILKKNRENHRKEFELALEGWYLQSVQELDRLLENAKKRKQESVFINLTRPEDHTPDYDRTIQMLEMDVDDTVIITAYEFQTYVQDDWDWKERWNTSNFSYVAAATTK